MWRSSELLAPSFIGMFVVALLLIVTLTAYIFYQYKKTGWNETKGNIFNKLIVVGGLGDITMCIIYPIYLSALDQGETIFAGTSILYCRYNATVIIFS